MSVQTHTDTALINLQLSCPGLQLCIVLHRTGKVAQPRVLRTGSSPHAASFLREVARWLRERGGKAGETSSSASTASRDQCSPAGGEVAAGPGKTGQTNGNSGKKPVVSFTAYCAF